MCVQKENVASLKTKEARNSLINSLLVVMVDVLSADKKPAVDSGKKGVRLKQNNKFRNA